MATMFVLIFSFHFNTDQFNAIFPQALKIRSGDWKQILMYWFVDTLLNKALLINV